MNDHATTEATANLAVLPDGPYAELSPAARDAEWHQTAEDEGWRYSTQSAWDRRQVEQLQTVQACVDDLADDDGTPDSVLVRNMLLRLGYTQGAHDHMEATRHEDERSFYAALCREYDARVITPTAVHTPGKRRKQSPRRDGGGRFTKSSAS